LANRTTEIEDIKASIADLNSGVQDVAEKYANVRDQITEGNQLRYKILLIGFIAPIALFGMAFVGALIPVRPASYLGFIYLSTS
jgi:hypothetical protein